MLAVAHRKIKITAPARLHLGFLDLSGSLDRKFGSIGVAINSHSSIVSVSSGETLSIDGVEKNTAIYRRIKALCQQFFNTLGAQLSQVDQPQFHIHALIPNHAGLGSGTQLTIIIGAALCKLYDIEASTAEIAAAMGRGKRSGIGIATFDAGGFVVDGGLAIDSPTPPLISRLIFPDQWRIVMIMDPQQQGVHGEQEQRAFQDLPAFPKQNSQEICQLTLMQLLPALIEQKIAVFGEALARIQALIGQHFAPYQGGQYSSVAVAKLLTFAQKLGHRGIAQSSWGPTGCIFVEDQNSAEALQQALKKQLANDADSAQNLDIFITSANNDGASVHVTSEHLSK